VLKVGELEFVKEAVVDVILILEWENLGSVLLLCLDGLKHEERGFGVRNLGNDVEFGELSGVGDLISCLLLGLGLVSSFHIRKDELKILGDKFD